MKVTYNVARNVTKAVESLISSCTNYQQSKKAYMVNKILMSKSQLHPVMKAAAAGGKRIAT